MLLIAVLMQLSDSQAYAQVVDTENTVSVPSNGMAGGANPSIWTARCKPGMVKLATEDRKSNQPAKV
jgi:hypothetical protein